MEVQFTAEQEAQLSRIANYNGTDAGQLVKEAALRLLEEDALFLDSVQRGVAAADRGEFVESAEVWSNVEQILRS